MSEESRTKRRGLLVAGSRGREIIDLLARRHSMTIRQIVDDLGVTTTAVRSQVNRLESEGWVERSQRRGGAGRPADVFRLTPRGRRLFSSRAEDTVAALIEAAFDKLGPAGTRNLLRGVGHRLAERSRGAVGVGSAEERIEKLARKLGDDGDLAESDNQDGRLKLAVFTCPYEGVADNHREICEMERQAFSELVGRPLRLSKRRPDGHRCCEFSTPAPTAETD